MSAKNDDEQGGPAGGGRAKLSGVPPVAPAAAPIVEAALKLLHEHRALDLTMREIAVAAGVAPSLVAYHFESRSHVIATACAVAGLQWREKLAEMEKLAGATSSMSRKAEICSAWMASLAADRPDLARLWGDLLLAAAREPMLAAVAQDWISAWRAAWLSVAGGNVEFAGIAAEFAAFEMIFTAPLLGIAERDLIMREALHRVFVRLETGKISAQDCFWHTQLCLDRMDPLPARPEPDKAVKARIIDAAADIIALEGTSAATHRAIAARAGASLSSMTYHFETRAILVREGLLRVFERSMMSSPFEGVDFSASAQLTAAKSAGSDRGHDGLPSESLAMLRAIAEVAQEAAIDPGFREVAMELRRIRGLVTRRSIARFLGFCDVAGADAADFAIWGSGAALLHDAGPHLSGEPPISNIGYAATVFFSRAAP